MPLKPSDGIAHLEAGAGATPSTLAINYVGGYAACARTITLTFTNGAAAFTDAASLKDPVWDAIKKSAQAPGSTPVVTGFRLYMNTGNIDSAVVKLYGIT